MTTKEFIEKVKQGGYETLGIMDDYILDKPLISIVINRLLLDPLAWQAVGKVMGWKQGVSIGGKQKVKGSEWWCKMHDMIDALCEGKSIEQFLETL